MVFLKSFLLLFFTFLLFQNLSAQNFSKKDTANFIYYPDKIMVRANLSTQTDSYFLKSKESVNLKLVPNNEYKLFFTVDYKFIGFSYGFFPKFFGANNDNDLKGKSSFSDYNFRLFLGIGFRILIIAKSVAFMSKICLIFYQTGIKEKILIYSFQTSKMRLSE
ncbi:hypothetical protein DCO46_21205, partial [Flavobacterium sp. HTF]